MAYNKNTWQDGDIITSSGLNNMENGIESNDTAITDLETVIPASASVSDSTMSFKNSEGDTLFSVNVPGGGGGGGSDEVLIVHFTQASESSPIVSDKTFSEISTAISGGLFVTMEFGGLTYLLCGYEANSYVAFVNVIFGAQSTRAEQMIYIMASDGTITSEYAITDAVPAAATATPQNLGTAAVGNSSKYARENHVHAMPTAANVGAIPAPSSPSSGQFLVYNGTAWAATTVPQASGVSF